jgi:large subunit ribosomal protein L10
MQVAITMSEKTQRAAPWKQERVTSLKSLLKKYPIVGALNLEGMPADALQQMRSKLRGRGEIFMTKKRLLGIALADAKLESLKPHLRGMPALLLTKDNPFALFKMIKKSRAPAAAKPGQIAPRDLIIPAGPTPFAPGPVISELAKLGIKAGVEGGKVAVKQDATVCKEGEVINADVAGLLSRLGMTPMEVGLDLVAVFEAGTIYPKKVLDIDEVVFMADLTTAAQEAFNLAVEATYPTADTTVPIIQRAFREAKALGLEANILEKDLVEELLGKAERAARGVKAEAKLE